MKPKLLSLVMLLTGYFSLVYAQAFTYEDLDYEVLSEDEMTCKITGANNKFGIRKLNIPSQVWYANKAYSVTTIGVAAFFCCDRLVSVVLPDCLTSIEDYAFSNTGLVSLNFPESLTGIGNYAFDCCTGLVSLDFPDGLTSIGNWAFNDCRGLVSLDFPEGLTGIGDHAFDGCTGLVLLDFPESLTVIGDYSFSGCTGLAALIINGRFDKIGQNPFPGNIRKVIYNVTNPNELTDNLSFYSEVYKQGMLLVPEEILEYAMASNIWSKFNQIVSLPKVQLTDTMVLWLGEENNRNQLKVTLPTDYTYLGDIVSISWKSSDANIVEVDGLNDTVNVMAINPGNAKVSCSINWGNLWTQVVTCEVEVRRTLSSLSIESDTNFLEVGKDMIVSAVLEPADAYYQDVTWTSSDDTVAQVLPSNNNKALVKALKAGKAKIVASAGSKEVGGYAEASIEVTVYELVRAITLNHSSLTLNVGEDEQLTTSVYPEGAYSATMDWDSTDENVATVSEDGLVTAVGPGTAVVTVQSDNGVSASCEVKVIQPITSITISPETLSVISGTTEDLTATILPENASKETMRWFSSDQEIAYVDLNGNVTGLNPGICEIWATNQDGSVVSNKCVVTVFKLLIESIEVNPTNWEGYVGDQFQIQVTILPEELSGKAPYWYSSDETVAIVNDLGFVTAVGVGTCDITAAADDGSTARGTCTITVLPDEILIESISLEPIQWECSEPCEFQITPSIWPEDATNKALQWSSSDYYVASVDEYGNVLVKNPGACVITAWTTDGSDLSAECYIQYRPVILIDPAELIINTNDYAQLRAVWPNGSVNGNFEWVSSNPDIASVNQDGEVSPKSPGQCEIMLQSVDYPWVSEPCHVTVVEVILDTYDWTAHVGDETTIKAYLQPVIPGLIDPDAIEWFSDNESVAVVDQQGNVQAVGVGDCNIYVYYSKYTVSYLGGAVCHIQVLPILAESLEIDPTSWSYSEGTSFHINYTILPDNATCKDVEWSSSDEEIAAVDSEGNVYIYQNGDCIITARTIDGSDLSAECIISFTTGLEQLFADKEDVFDIYTLEGVLLKKDADVEDAKTLEKGVYILRQGDKSRKLIIR